MPNTHLHTAISAPRFSKYLIACGNNKRKALKLYRANITLSQRLYAVIGVFEIILRNSIDRHYIPIKGADWLSDSIQPGGFLDGPGCEDSFHFAQETIQRLYLDYTHDSLISGLTFGFWTYQYSPKVFRASGNTLLDVFSARPFGTKQKDIFQNLFRINDIRNRVAHYEPLCFDKATGNISTVFVRKRYTLILDMFDWIGANKNRVLYGINKVPQAIDMIDRIYSVG